MPLVRVSLLAGRSREEKRAMADHIYDSMRETIGIPENDKFILFDEHSADTFFADRSFLGVERSDGLLIVEITFRRGRSVEAKQALYARIAERLHEHVGVRKEDVLVVVRENESPDWSFGNGVAQYVAG